MIRCGTRRSKGGVTPRASQGHYGDKQDRELVRLYHQGDQSAKAELDRRIKRGRFIVGL
jgi:hypothetical protein